MKDNEAYIFALLASRNSGAVSVMSKSYGKLLYSLAYRITGSKEDAEEVVSDTLMEVWNTPPDTIQTSVMSFACMIARSRALDKVRRTAAEARKARIFAEVQSELLADFNEDSITDSLVISRVTEEFLLSLSSIDRYIFMCRYFEYAEYSEICKETRLKSGAVRMRLSRMRAELKRRLEKAGITV